jgi:hypothetical protein
MSEEEFDNVYNNNQSNKKTDLDNYNELEKAHTLKEKGILTEEEYQTKRNSILGKKQKVSPINDKSNWIQRHPVVFALLVIFIVLPVTVTIISSIFGSKTDTLSEEDTTKVVEARANAVFNLSGLASSTIQDVVTKLGEPSQKYMPTQARLSDGENPDFTYKKDGESLLVTYNNKTKKVVDFFLTAKEGHTNINSDADKQLILAKLGLRPDTQEYSVEYVKALKDDNQFTGVTLTKLDPLATEKEDNARSFASHYIKYNIPLKSPSTADYKAPWYATKIDDNLYEVNSYVDAQNSFGAEIRNNWTMKVQYTGEEIIGQVSYINNPSNWKIVYLKFGDTILIKS